MPSFSNKKALRFVITLGTGTFGSSGSNQITLQGFRASATIDKGGGAMFGTLRAQIWGVSQSNMNSVTTLKWQPIGSAPSQQITNQVQVYAIDGAQETLVFSGWIVQAWGNYQAMPDVFLEIQANPASLGMLTAIPPTSFKGTADTAATMQQIIATMNQKISGLNFTFENNGVSIPLSNPYLSNSGIEQLKSLANAAGCWFGIDNNTVFITPKNQPRLGLIPEVSAQTGLRGYPTFDGVGINCETLFNPSITFMGSIKLVTSVTRAAGQWIVTGVNHRLESEKPDGAWFSTIRGNASGIVPTT